MTLEEKYELGQPVGVGGFGTVYRAIERATRLVVAIKVLTDSSNADARNRFRREIEILSKTKHTNVIRLLDADADAEPPYLVMPFMEGGTLTKWAGRLEPAQLKSVFLCLTDVLASLHRDGSIHRDFKPDNVLVDAKGGVAVADFGLGNNPKYTVKFTASAAGTAGYAAPELFQPFGLASRASDVYSLGATMFHLVTGVHPKGVTNFDPRSRVRDCDEMIADLICQMTQKKPEARPTADAVLTKLGAKPPVRAPAAPSSGGFTPRTASTTVSGGRYA